MRFFWILGFILCSSITVLAQGEIDSTPKALTRHEYTLGGILYNSGWGAEFSYGKMKNIKLKALYSVDFAVVHAAKEIKISNPYSPKNSRYVYGKTHSLINLRLTYGKLYRFYQKLDKGGIEVRGYYKIGAVFGFVKPIYYKIGREEKIEKFNSAAHVSSESIYGKASIFKGFSEIKIVPGVNMKAALSFEFGKKDLIINAIEGGVSADVFPKQIELMANDYNDFYFVSLFIVGRFGKVVNPRMKYLIPKK